MQGALKGVPEQDFQTPTSDDGTKVAVPDVAGLTVEAATEQLRSAGFGVVVGAPVNAAPVPKGSVAGTRPAAGTQVPAGSTVTVVPSNGLAPAPAPTPTSSPGPTPPGNGPPGPPDSTASPTPSPTKKRGR